MECLIQKWPRKLFIISILNIIQNNINNNIQFIINRFNQIIDCIITLLKISSLKI